MTLCAGLPTTLDRALQEDSGCKADCDGDAAQSTFTNHDGNRTRARPRRGPTGTEENATDDVALFPSGARAGQRI